MLGAFAALDWLIVLAYVFGATVAGLLCRKYIHGIADFIVAGRTLGVFLGVATLAGTELGLVTVVYWAEQGYTNGFSALILGVLAGGSLLFVGLTGFLVKGLRASGAMTLAEYYQMRYSQNVRLLGGLIIAVAGILNMGVFLKAGALFLRHVMNLPDTLHLSLAEAGSTVWAANLPMVNVLMTVLLVFVLLYTLAGGMVSVVLTDYFQFLVLSVGIAGATWYAWTRGGFESFEQLTEIVREQRGAAGFSPILAFGVVWILWQTLHWLGTSTWQTYALRTTSVDSPRTAKTMYALTGLIFFARAAIPMLWGIAALAFFATSGRLGEVPSLEAMPAFMGQILPVGLAGLLVAGMLAAFMSTHDSYLLAWSAVLTQDVVGPCAEKLGRPLSARTRIWLTRMFIILIGLFLLVWGLWYQLPGTMWSYLAITGTIYISGAATILGFGLYWRRANIVGAYAALICGAVPGLVYLFINILNQVLSGPQAAAEAGTLARIAATYSDAWAGLLSYPLAVLGMIVGSLLGARTRPPAAIGIPTPAPGPGPEAGREAQA